MSFPVPVDTAAPLPGAANPAKASKAPHGDAFAALMNDAAAGNGTDDNAQQTTSTQGSPDGQSLPGHREHGARQASASQAEASAAAEESAALSAQTAPVITTPNLAGFFRSLRAQHVETPVTAKAQAEAPQTGTPAASTSPADTAAPVIVTADVAIALKDVPVETVALSNAASTTADVVADMAATPTALESDPSGSAVLSEPVLVASALGTPVSPDGVMSAIGATANDVFTRALSGDTASVSEFSATAATAEAVREAVTAVLGNASASVPGEPYVLAATAPHAEVAAAVLRQMAASLPAETASAATVTSSASPEIATAIANALSANAAASAPTSAGAAAPVSTTALPLVAPGLKVAAPTAINAATQALAAAKTKIAAVATEVPTPRVDRTVMASQTLASLGVPHLLTPLATTPNFGPAATASIATVIESQMADQVVQSMKMQFDQGGGEATIELNPEYLGRVQVNVRVEHGTVSASVQASTPLVREWIASHRDELSQTLSQQGLKLDRLEVAESPKDQASRDNGRDARQPQREAARQRRDAREDAAETFELQDSQEIA